MTVPGDPFADFRIAVEIGGALTGWFTEVSSLSVERDVMEQPEGGVNDHLAYLPGRVGRGNITLKHGIAGEELWTWFQKGLLDGQVERRSISLLLYPAGSDTPKRWDLTDALPVRWKGVNLKAGGGTVAIEELVFGLGPMAQGESPGGSAGARGGRRPAHRARRRGRIQRSGNGVAASTMPARPKASTTTGDATALSGDELQALAGRVYALLRQELRFERERRGRDRAW